MTIHYTQAGDGTVVAWGEEHDPVSRERRWGASAWTADPRHGDKARHIDRLAADYTHAEMRLAVDAYLREHAQPADPPQPSHST